MSILRDAILEVARGFTEIMPGQLEDLLPGPGIGYIIGLVDVQEKAKLTDKLIQLAHAWGLSPPKIIEASSGPRGGHCFFLIPRLANRDSRGWQRPLFSPEKSARLEDALRARLSHQVQMVYGEWLPWESYREKDADISSMFVCRWHSIENERFVEAFIRKEVFDGGKECDQEAIYLSVKGIGRYVYEG